MPRFRVMVTVPQQFVEVVEADTHRTATELVLTSIDDNALVPFVTRCGPAEISVTRIEDPEGRLGGTARAAV